jgi:hypothetical protein
MNNAGMLTSRAGGDGPVTRSTDIRLDDRAHVARLTVTDDRLTVTVGWDRGGAFLPDGSVSLPLGRVEALAAALGRLAPPPGSNRCDLMNAKPPSDPKITGDAPVLEKSR